MFLPVSLRPFKKETGQSLIEVLVALVVSAMIITALIMTVLEGLKNAQYAQNQAQATKLAQDALDKITSIRDRDMDNSVDFNYTSGVSSLVTTKFSDLWNIYMESQSSCGPTPPNPCYFKFDPNSPLRITQDTSGKGEDLGNGLTRQIIFEDSNSKDSFGTELYKTEKTIIVKVTWSDASGPHESNLQTILTQH
ncbi:MAG: prepilin-type N-terminal cleavage/methylation domain-containing protein [Patescibacteria group bacterium]|nr:prepilin-type N-terminal cleavage/methylation domain-containing protein [Patescibacteria group bacterium]